MLVCVEAAISSGDQQLQPSDAQHVQKGEDKVYKQGQNYGSYVNVCNISMLTNTVLASYCNLSKQNVHIATYLLHVRSCTGLPY